MASNAEIFILTFLCYVSIHALRTTYSFSKHFLDEALQVNKSVIGFVDSMLLLSLGFGHFMHALHPLKLPVRSLWIATILCALDYMLIPLLIETLHIRSFWLLFGLMAINGYLQSFTWPNLLMIVHSHFDPKKNTTLLGFWATNVNIGNIAGYLICYEFVMSYGFHWEVGMYMTGLFVAVMAILVGLRVEEIHSPDDQKHTAEQQKILAIDRKELQEHTKLSHVFNDQRIVFITLAFSLIKSVIYGIMLWVSQGLIQLPIYFHDIGMAEYETWIPSVYDLASVMGSMILGYLFKRIKYKGALLGPLMLVLVILFVNLRYMQLGVRGYFILIAGVGACLGGSFNTMAGLVTMQLARVVPAQYQNQCLGFFSALTMSVANVTTAVTQILIGYVAQKGKFNRNVDEPMIFIIFLFYSLFALICFLLVTRREFIEQKATHPQQNSKLKKVEKAFGSWLEKETLKKTFEKEGVNSKKNQ